MATPRLVNVDRDTPMLLPPDLREWVPQGDMVHFVIAAVAGMPLPTLTVNRRGSGSHQYPPKMMLALLIYCYANGIFGSRRIERATYRDVAVRFLTGDTHPDHDTICKFRREHFAAVAQAFLEVLKLAKEMGVLQVGTVSVDGTHIAANARKDRNVRYDRAGELEKQLQGDIAELLQKAEQADQTDGGDSGGGNGQSLPDDIARRQKLLEKMQAARARLAAQAQARAAAERADYERKAAASAPPESPESPAPPVPPVPPVPPAPAQPAPEAQTNLTDGDSRLMRKSRRSAYAQAYNAQAVVDAEGSQLILGGHVSTCANDANELRPALQTVPAEIGTVTAALADSGYVNREAFAALAQEPAAPELYVAVGREENQRRYDYRPKEVTDKPAKVFKDPTLLAMQAKLQTPAGRQLYALRQQTVEPVFGIIKSVLGFRQFLLRGLAKVSGEWTLVRLAYNVKRLWTLRPAAA